MCVVRVVHSHARPIAVAAGALLPDGVVTSDPDSVERTNGSVVFLRAETVEEVWEILKNDPFYTSGEVVS